MRSKQASNGRMMRRGSEAGRGRTSTWIWRRSGGFVGLCFTRSGGMCGNGERTWPPPIPSTLLPDLPPWLPLLVWFPQRLLGLILCCVLLCCLGDKMCVMEPPRPPPLPPAVVVLLCCCRRVVMCSRLALFALFKPVEPWYIWWWGKMVKWSSPFAGWMCPAFSRKTNESLRGVAGVWPRAVLSADLFPGSWLLLSLRVSSMATRPCTTSRNVKEFRTSDAWLRS